MSILVVGASGAVGRFLLPRLLDAGHEVLAVSRGARPSTDARLRWEIGNLEAALPLLPPLQAIFSLGPLDAFARWFARTELAGAPRVIALGSMSVETKRASDDATERALAQRLHVAERTLAAAATARGCAWTVLRPTLIYGAGVDRSLTPIAHFARRWHVFPRVRAARGLRQPVHADDLAAACCALLARASTAGRSYALGGGEQLAFGTLLERVRASLATWCVQLPIPLGMASAFAGAAAAAGLPAPGAAAIKRLTCDLIVDHAAAIADFDWAPRAFHPSAATWETTPVCSGLRHS